MGYGDEIMASGHALSVHRTTGKRVRIVEADGRPRWSDLWRGLDWIVGPGESAGGATDLPNGPGCRPYIRYPFNRTIGCTYADWRARDHVGVIALSDQERAAARKLTRSMSQFIVVEPNLDPRGNPNKQWGRSRWQALVDLIHRDVQVVQFAMPGRPVLRNVRPVKTRSFREAAAVLELATTSVLPEGGLHHASGALRRPAVVLFGGSVDVRATGYDWHDNVCDEGEGSPCGAWSPCDHCRKAWERLAPTLVADVARQILECGR